MNKFLTPAELTKSVIDAFEKNFGPNWFKIFGAAWNEAIRKEDAETGQLENDAKA